MCIVHVNKTVFTNREERRLKVAQCLDDKLPDACWHDLVMWAVYPEHNYPGRLHEAAIAGRTCRQEKEGCYCGKFMVEEGD